MTGYKTELASASEWAFDPRKIFVLEAVSLAPGTYKGILGDKEVEYSAEVVEKIAKSALYKQIVLLHTSRKATLPEAGSAVGSIINVGYANGKGLIKYTLNDPELARLAKANKLMLSMEAEIQGEEIGGKIIATDGVIKAVALEPDVACESCVNISTTEVHLSSTKLIPVADKENTYTQKLILQGDETMSDEKIDKLTELVTGLVDSNKVMQVELAKLKAEEVPAPESPPVTLKDVEEVVAKSAAETAKEVAKNVLEPFNKIWQKAEDEKTQAKINELKTELLKEDKDIDFEVELAPYSANPEGQINTLTGMLSMAKRIKGQAGADGEHDLGNPDNGSGGAGGSDDPKTINEQADKIFDEFGVAKIEPAGGA